MAKLAVIDIGTNSIHMVLAEILPDASYKILDRFKDMTRLGNGAFAAKRLSDEAIGRGVGVLKTLVTLARNKGFERIAAVATSAVREAKNGGDFVDLVEEQTGIKIRVISGIEEARLIFLGVRHSMALSDKPTLVVDVGGGSVELIVGTRDGLQHAKSLKLGAIRLSDQYVRKTPPTEAMVMQLNEAVSRALKGALDAFNVKPFDAVVATSGMAGNVAEIVHLKQTGRPLPQLNLAKVRLKDLRMVEAELSKSSVKARLGIPGLDPKRVDTLFPAVVVLRRLLELSGTDEMTVCDKAIREGVIYDFIDRHRDGLDAEREIPDVRRRNVIGLARRCHAPEVHSLHVASLALRLFDQTKRLHHLGEVERSWLEYAAVLHDIGYLINPRQHHKHAYYLIKNSDIGGLTAEEIEVVANIARYHRRSMPAAKHEGYADLSLKLKRTVRILSALLRVADALDRTHFSVVQTVNVKIGQTLTIMATVSGDAAMEMWSASQRTDLLEQVFRRRVQFSEVPQPV
ncbi:Ppx/GppA phosphatase family protein [Nitrospira lenta]|uniref:Putative Exopolyphosphatase n=1 Tax=Nitrospira lenta TaxID=1436998 RepID=A0A330L938_9BACT|nr:Ppx/GppA phosphatase family protein [Nitrospira lenta]SPP66229.1 putative Exopolyphosphatase [Nitrospira lenta]